MVTGQQLKDLYVILMLLSVFVSNIQVEYLSFLFFIYFRITTIYCTVYLV